MRAILIAASGALVAAAAVPPVVASDSAPAGGRSASSGTILELTLADDSIAINVDDLTAQVANDATASLVLGRHGTAEVGKVQAKRSTGTQRADLVPGELALGEVVSVNLAEGSAVAKREDGESAVATVATVLADASANPGVEAGQVEQRARAFSGTDRARATRTITIEQLDVLTVGDLVGGLGIGLLSMTCEQVESLAETLGADAATACALLSDVETTLTSAVELLDDAEADATTLRDATQLAIDAQQVVVDAATALVEALTAQRNTLAAQTAGLNRATLEAQLATIEAQIAPVETACTTLGLMCDVLATLEAQAATVSGQLALLDQLDAITDDLAAAVADLAVEQAALDALVATLASANSILDALAGIALGSLPTCGEAAAALGQVGDVTPSLRHAASVLASALDTVCGLLGTAVDALLGTSLLSIAGVEVTLEAATEKGSATSVLDGSIGSISVGSLPPVAVDLPVTLSSLDLGTASNTVEGALADVLEDLGFSAAELEITLFDLTKHASVDAGGSASAGASMTLLSLRVPELTYTPSALAPLAPLGDLSPGVNDAGDQTIGPFAADAGVFEVSAAFPVAAVNTGPPPPTETCPTCTPGGGGGLPITGVNGSIELAAILLYLAARIGRRAHATAPVRCVTRART